MFDNLIQNKLMIKIKIIFILDYEFNYEFKLIKRVFEILELP